MVPPTDEIHDLLRDVIVAEMLFVADKDSALYLKAASDGPARTVELGSASCARRPTIPPTQRAAQACGLPERHESDIVISEEIGNIEIVWANLTTNAFECSHGINSGNPGCIATWMETNWAQKKPGSSLELTCFDVNEPFHFI